ncbi:hypothetical protein [Actibacterium lipolyticum]|uniref:Uncharacterized protein n=1 Tax=Actibacterium lipolyticum TaxID=1524263 RepID=A0A238JV42_9RHOB|nr:hypothetical protein [Actibacterium lipolyticum]SMX34529.1 hypothetical protein COL8621_01355 [Actibacterium lipolyticum]
MANRLPPKPKQPIGQSQTNEQVRATSAATKPAPAPKPTLISDWASI